jgi:hypothetical protein
MEGMYLKGTSTLDCARVLIVPGFKKLGIYTGSGSRNFWTKLVANGVYTIPKPQFY